MHTKIWQCSPNFFFLGGGGVLSPWSKILGVAWRLRLWLQKYAVKLPVLKGEYKKKKTVISFYELFSRFLPLFQFHQVDQ